MDYTFETRVTGFKAAELASDQVLQVQCSANLYEVNSEQLFRFKPSPEIQVSLYAGENPVVTEWPAHMKSARIGTNKNGTFVYMTFQGDIGPQLVSSLTRVFGEQLTVYMEIPPDAQQDLYGYDDYEVVDEEPDLEE